MEQHTPAEQPQRQRWVKASDVAEALDVSRKTVSSWIRDGRIKAIRTPGGQFRIPAEELDRVLGEVA